jgi:hypothetical protein
VLDPGEGEDSGADVLGVGEAQRGVVAVHDESGGGSGVGVVVDVVESGQVGHLALDGVVGAGDAGEELGDAEGDGDADAGEQVEGYDAGGAPGRCASGGRVRSG